MLPEGITVVKDEIIRRFERPFRHVILDTEPQVRTIRFLPRPLYEAAKGLEKSYLLAFPKMRFAFWSDAIAVAFVQDETYFVPMLPNVHNNGLVCMGLDFSQERTREFVCKNAEDAIRHLGIFWASQFDIYPRTTWKGIDHLGVKFASLFGEGRVGINYSPARAFHIWQEETRKDPDFINHIEFLPAYKLNEVWFHGCGESDSDCEGMGTE